MNEKSTKTYHKIDKFVIQAEITENFFPITKISASVCQIAYYKYQTIYNLKISNI